LLQSLVRDGDKDLATIASASGWLRGFGLAAAEIAQSYQGETSRLLRQPELAKHLADRVRKLPDGVIVDSAKAADCLQQIATLCAVKQDADISKESVEKITAAAKDGLAALAGTPNKK
jgi:L-aminopeptidase/D-esterase-like protein